jgi:hypothetical protein
MDVFKVKVWACFHAANSITAALVAPQMSVGGRFIVNCQRVHRNAPDDADVIGAE